MMHYTPVMTFRCRFAAWRERRRLARAMRNYRRAILRDIETENGEG